MKERITSNNFKQEIIQYFPIYQTFLTAQNTSCIMPNGPKFSVNGYDEFNSGTKQVLQSVLGSGGAPLSYVIRNMKCRPRNSALRLSTRCNKIYWKAPLCGAVYNADNLCVLTYLLRQCRNTPGWVWIQQYRTAGNGIEIWLALCRNHGVNDIESPGDPSYENDDYIYINHKLPIYIDVYGMWYQARLNGHAPMPSEMMDLEMEFFTASRC